MLARAPVSPTIAYDKNNKNLQQIKDVEMGVYLKKYVLVVKIHWFLHKYGRRKDYLTCDVTGLKTFGNNTEVYNNTFL